MPRLRCHMPHEPRVCVVGSANMDLTFRTARLPGPGETLAGERLHMGFGGKGANQAVMAARFGVAVSMVGRVGRDAFGDKMLANFAGENIDTTHVIIDEDASSGVASI